MGSSTTLFERFSPAADLTVIAVCIVMAVLMFFSYVSRGRSLRIFLGVVAALVLAAMTDVSWNMIVRMQQPSLYTLCYVLRVFYHAMLYITFHLYCTYIAEVTGLDEKKKMITAAVSGTSAAAFIIGEIALSFSPMGFRIQSDGTVWQGFNLFLAGYIVFTLMLLVLLIRVRGYLYRRVMMGFYGAIAVAYAMMLMTATLMDLHPEDDEVVHLILQDCGIEDSD